MTDLKIARGLALDPDYVGGGTFALLAKKGAGKTYTGRVMAEEFWHAKVPFVVLDPMGAWWGLRAAADGGPDGIPVAIFGGDHADAPLERTGGTVMADLVVDEGLSMILDMSALGSRAAERQFAVEFLERLYRRNSELVHVFVDEADLFAPQKPQAGDQQLLGVTENIVRRGRNRGIGITLITQRPAVLNKDVLTQVDGLVAMRIVGLTDRKAIDEWVKGHGDDEAASKVKATLSGLANGECWWWVPELDILSRVQVRQSHTFDSSPTKKRGEKRREPKSFADVDMGAVEEKMAATIERAKAEDPKQLRRQIAELRKQLAKAGQEQAPAPPPEPVVEYVDRPVLEEEHIEALRELVEGLGEHAGKVIGAANDIGGGLRKLTGHVPRVEAPARPAPQQRAVAAPPRRSAPARAAEASEPSGDLQLKAGARRIVETLARHYPMRVTKAQLGTLAKFKITGGTFQTYYSLLKREGLIVESGGEIEITQAGLDYVGAEVGTPMTTEEVVEQWRSALKAGARKMLDELLAVHPDEISKEELADRVEMTESGGTFQTYLGTLRRNGLAEVDGGYVRAGEALFLGATA